MSDREAEARARYDSRWKVALGIGLEEAGFDSTTLSVFRTRLLLNQLDELVFRRMLEAAVERGLISGRLAEQVIDSTHTLGAGA
ncbi:MAG: transposase, partial [Bacillota bacterium]